MALTDEFPERAPGTSALDSPKFVGEMIGEVIKLGRTHFDVLSDFLLHNGDGITYYNEKQELVGTRCSSGRRRVSPLARI